MPGMRFGVLGPLAVEVDGRAVAVPAGRRRTALACLLLHAGRPVEADALVDAVWGEQLPGDPHAALHIVISRLRAVLGTDAVRREAAGYVLDVPADAVDAIRFEQQCRRADEADSAGAAELLREALALWRGPAYAEVADRGFAMLEAQRLDALRLEAVEARSAALLDMGEPAAAIEGLAMLLAEQPFREHAVMLQVTALYRAGRQTDALARCREHRTTLVDELGLDPSPAMVELESRILGHDVDGQQHEAELRAHPGPPAWFDTSTEFVGRDDVLSDLIRLLRTSRVVTVTGAGGVGKSRLVAEAQSDLAEALRLPVVVVELAAAAPGDAVGVIAAALGLRVAGDLARGAVFEQLASAPVLLVLDCCEHLLTELAALAAHIARRCPQARILATSRHRLATPSEAVLPLAPLALPEAGSPFEQQRLAPAMRLLAERIQRIRPSFRITSDTVTDAVALCRRLDGLPLALELAASRAATLGLEQVLRRLEEEALEPGGELEALFAWSYGLLNAEQQRVLHCLAAFAGDPDADDVLAMAGHLQPAVEDAVGALAELVESSLIAQLDVAQRARYGLTEIVRAFAVRQLGESGDPVAVHRAHVAWVREVVEACRRDWPHRDGAELGRRMDRAAPEVVVALRRALQLGWLEPAAGICGAVALCLHWTPPRELSDLMLEVAEAALADAAPREAESSEALADGVAAGGFVAAERGDLAGAERLAHAALAMRSEGGACVLAQLTLAVAAMYAGDLGSSARWFTRLADDPGMAAEAHSSLALASCFGDDLGAARQHASIALAAAAGGADATAAFADYAAGEVASRMDVDRGAALFAKAVAEADRVGAEQVGRVARIARFALLVRAGRHEEAVSVGATLLYRLPRAGLWPQAWTTVRISAELLAARGLLHEAALLLAAAAAAPSAPPLIGADVEHYARLDATLAAKLGWPVIDGIAAMATSVPRAQIVVRAVRALRRLQTQ